MISFLYNTALIAVAGTLDRVGGWRYKFVRRFGLPIFFFVQKPDIESFAACLLLSVLLTFNLDEIEEWDLDDVFNYGVALSFCFYHFAGFWALILGVYWLVGVYASNRVIQITFLKKFNVTVPKIDWKYIEFGRGVVMQILVILWHIL